MRALPAFAVVAAASVLGAGAALAQTAAPPAPAPAMAPGMAPGMTMPAAAATPAPALAPPPEPVTMAPLKGADGADLGTVTGYEGPMGMIFRIDGKGWPAGWHAVHLHAVGTCDGPAFTSAGGHVNHAEGARKHGLLNADGGPDLGDLQNVYAAADGTVHADVYLSWEGLGATEADYVDSDGLSFLVHASADDYVSQPIGGAGARIGCGVFAPAGG